MGPFQTWDAIGVKESVEKMEADGMAVPESVKAMLAAGNDSFYQLKNGKPYYYDFATGSYQAVKISDNIISLAGLKADNKTVKTCKSASLVDIGDDVFCLEFHTKMNAINGEIVDFMAEGLDYVDANGAGLVIGNQAGGMPGRFPPAATWRLWPVWPKKANMPRSTRFSKRARPACRRFAMPVFRWWRPLTA
jgi:3-hydroxyacyl-CoA dehydrogenase